MQKEAEYGKDWPDKPVNISATQPLYVPITHAQTACSQNDSITWLLDLAVGERRSVRSIILRVLATNFTAMHTSSMVRYPYTILQPF